MTKAIVSLSGGMDSATVLSHCVDIGVEVIATCSFYYGSKHNAYEKIAVEQLLHHFAKEHGLKVHHFGLNLLPIFRHFTSNLLQSGGEIPEGHYEEESMKQTVVPGRNTIFNAILLGFAETLKADAIFVGVHHGDHAIYPDCRAQYVVALRQAFHVASDGNVDLVAPFLNKNKGEIVYEGLKIGTPYQFTRTCYKDQPVACGKCGSCQERLEAFAQNNANDPIEYENREILPKST